ncbi:nitroreductase family deazaflavin-dependent oxidoreductase [Amycolatopsis taiwanensis]|uniref:nitroreductase family deazaflavin-dependent oxidoreductase n=1 Tax=Amycolatopsis taiwanensis TaxID=342230 RepID=UPI000482BC65|nr:nitroreductase family deazaflavin-dependent oxidoreductase [Amycolatopsis taiwanensis]
MNELRYVRSGKGENVFHRAVGWLAKHGVSLLGTRMLYVRGRKSGELRSTPVNLLVVDGERYLVAPRGHTQWVRNLRVAGEGQLRLGRRCETFHAVELSDDEKMPVLRTYLEKWAWEVGRFFEGLKADSPDETVRDVAPNFPVFRLTA